MMEAIRNHEIFKDIVENIQIKHCPECEKGQIREVVGYESYGSTIDYVYETFKTPFVFVFEIYSEPQSLSPRFLSLEEEKASSKENIRLQSLMMSRGYINIINKTNGFPIFRELRVFENPEECFRFFNPVTKTAYSSSVNKWKEVL